MDVVVGMRDARDYRICLLPRLLASYRGTEDRYSSLFANYFVFASQF